MVFKKWQKPFKKVEVEKKEEVIEETPVTSVVENEISNEEVVEVKNIPAKAKKDAKVIWEVGWSTIVKPVWRIKFEAQVAPYPMFKLPADIRQYLISNWFTTEVYKKDKEWLDKHWANLEMIEKLKRFLTEKL